VLEENGGTDGSSTGVAAGRGKAMMVAAALDRGSPGQRGDAATETVKARQLQTGALRRRSDRAGPVSGPWRSERRFYARACGDGRTPPHSANRGTSRGGLAIDRRAPHVSFFSSKTQLYSEIQIHHGKNS
jgi:hypothetical protein